MNKIFINIVGTGRDLSIDSRTGYDLSLQQCNDNIAVRTGHDLSVQQKIKLKEAVK